MNELKTIYKVHIKKWAKFAPLDECCFHHHGFETLHSWFFTSKQKAIEKYNEIVEEFKSVSPLVSETKIRDVPTVVTQQLIGNSSFSVPDKPISQMNCGEHYDAEFNICVSQLKLDEECKPFEILKQDGTASLLSLQTNRYRDDGI